MPPKRGSKKKAAAVVEAPAPAVAEKSPNTEQSAVILTDIVEYLVELIFLHREQRAQQYETLKVR